jgi:hypothetical protein
MSEPEDIPFISVGRICVVLSRALQCSDGVCKGL